MLTDAMDFDPRISSNGQGWHCNFHYGHGHDIFEDNAINEKSCVQALRYLIAKADAEIHDLEDELAILQCQLKWADSNEQRNHYEVCCATFKRKIDVLTESIRNVRNRNILNEHDMDTTVKIQRPERICDIISALVKQKFSAPDEQVENLSCEINSLVNSGSVDIGTDLKQKEPFSVSPADSKDFTTDFESLCKHADTVSEESCSDTTRYTIRDSVEARDGSKTVEVTKKTEVDAYECPAEGNNELLGSSKANNNSGNSIPIAVQHEDENKECMTASKYSGSDSSPIGAKAKVIVKVEEDNNDLNFQHIAADSLCKKQEHESEFPIDACQEMKDFQSPTVENIQITYERKKSSLGVLLNPQRLKMQRKNPRVAKQNNLSLMRKPRGKIGKREFHSDEDNRQSNSPSSEVEEFCSLSNSNCQRLPADVTHENQLLLLGDKKQKLAGASIENSSIQSQQANDSKEDDLCGRGNLASKSQNELVMCLESPSIAEGTASQLDPSPAGPHDIESNSTIIEDVDTKGSPACDLESLKSEFSKDPDYLKKMKVAQLKEYLKLYKVRGLSKFKKEKMIDELNTRLKST